MAVDNANAQDEELLADMDDGDLAVVNVQVQLEKFLLLMAVDNAYADRKWNSKSQYCVCTLYCLLTFLNISHNSSEFVLENYDQHNGGDNAGKKMVKKRFQQRRWFRRKRLGRRVVFGMERSANIY